MQTRERAPPPPLRRAVRFARHRPHPTISPSTAEPPQGGFQDHEDPTAILRPSEDARPFSNYSRRLPSTRGPALSPERHSRYYTHPSRGNHQGPLSEFSAPLFSANSEYLVVPFPLVGGAIPCYLYFLSFVAPFVFFTWSILDENYLPWFQLLDSATPQVASYLDILDGNDSSSQPSASDV